MVIVYNIIDMNLENLFNPKSIAIIGASEEEGKVGNVIAKNILTLGYSGEVFLINPKHEILFGRKCYKSLNEIENTVDLAIIAIPAKLVIGEIEKNSDRIKNYVIISAGFSEIGQEGQEKEEALKKISQEKNLNILGPNCLGFIIPGLSLNASFAGGMPKLGNIALISQSGALAVGMMDIFDKEGMGFSHVISVGNKMEISEIEIMDYLAANDNVRVIGMYLEGIKDGLGFLKIAGKVSKVKPIILLKAGRSEKAQKAISSHTGALAGNDKIISAICKKTGIIRADSLEEFLDLVNLISLSPAPKSNMSAIITNAGGPGVLTTDAFSGKEMKLAEINEKIKSKLKEFLPEESALDNPIDLLGDAKEDRYKKALALLGKNDSFGSYICVLTPQDQTPVAKIASKIVQFKKKTNSTVVTVFIGGKRVERAAKKLRENGIANFHFPERAVKALDKYYFWNKQALSENSIPKEINLERQNKVSEIIKKAKSENRSALYFEEAKSVMDMYGIKTADAVEVGPNTVSGPIVGFPAVLKVDSDKVLHKTDKQGLILNIKNDDELKTAVSQMQNNFPGEKLIVQPMLERQTELILGIKKDDIFGPVLVYGLGGIYTEVFKMVDFLVPPLAAEGIEQEIGKSKISFLFQDTRGQKPYNIQELANILWGLNYLATENPQIMEFDINPLLIYNDGKEAVAVDVKIII